ncbi:hypothetical protein [Streptobacillus moniliformis]|uniref:hypothetical protein n=1 Tax=Streptobacillus moniliformis TaxID=34105 RepID=UPI0007EEBBAF|nr:hypothetical protein [Streptobacillus moniliformis]
MKNHAGYYKTNFSGEIQMKKKIMVIIAILMNIISFSQVTRARFLSKDIEIQKFSTKNEKFSYNDDLIIPEIKIKENEPPILTIRFIEIGKLHGTKKIEISNNEKTVVLFILDGEAKFAYIDGVETEVVDKTIDLKDLENLLDMAISENKIKINFIGYKNISIIKDVNEREKEILKWTILNYIALL